VLHGLVRGAVASIKRDLGAGGAAGEGEQGGDVGLGHVMRRE
jgi:hypothetical protein